MLALCQFGVSAPILVLRQLGVSAPSLALRQSQLISACILALRPASVSQHHSVSVTTGPTGVTGGLSACVDCTAMGD